MTTTTTTTDFRMPLSLARIAAPKPATCQVEARRIISGRAMDETFPVHVNARHETDLPSNWEFRLHIDAPAGYVYLVNPSLAGNGAPGWVMLLPSTSTNRTNRQHARTAWLGFDGEPGVEHLHLIWSKQPIAGLSASPRLEPVPLDGAFELLGLPHGAAHRMITLKHH